MPSSTRLFHSALSATLLSLIAGPAMAQLTNLSQFTNPNSFVRDFRFAAPVGRIIYDEDVNQAATFDPDVRNVFSVVPNQPGTRIRLNNLVGTNAERIRSWKVSPDGTRVAMLGDLVGNGIVQLFTASTSQPGTQVRFDTNTATGQSYEIFEFEFTPDSSRIVARARISGAFRLISAPATGGAAINVSPVSPNDVRDFRMLENGTQVLYRGDLFDGTDELYLASVSTAGTSLRLTEVAGGSADVTSQYAVAPNGNDVVFAVNLFLQSRDQLLRKAINPSGTQSSITFSGAANSRVRALVRPENNGRVQFVADFDVAGRNKVYSKVPSIVDPFIVSAHVEVPTGSVTASSIARTPDGSRVLYLGNLTTSARIDLYSASVDTAGSQVRLSSPSLALAQVSRFVITPNGTRAVYSGTLEESGFVDLYSASVSAADTQMKLYLRQPNESVVDWALSPDGSRVIFTVFRNAPTATLNVWTVPVDGSSAATLAAPFTGFGVTALTKTAFTSGGIGIVGGNQLYTLPAPKTAPPARPRLSLSGKSRIRTSAARVVLRGRTFGEQVRRVETKFRNPKKRMITRRIPVDTKGAWRFVLRPNLGRNVVSLQAVDSGNRRSAVTRVIVTRVPRKPR